jgi:hypothetical protein
LALLLSSLLFALVPAIAQKKNTVGMPDRERERRSLAANIVRAINTAEANYKRDHGSYATWDALLANGDFSENGTKWASEALPTVAHAMYGPGPEIVPGWKLRLDLSKDGAKYDLLLQDANDTKCGFAFVSNESGLIWQAKNLDCPV